MKYFKIVIFIFYGLLCFNNKTIAQSKKRLVTPCYVFGSYHNSTLDALVSIPASSYSAGAWVDGLPQDSIIHLATHGQIGATYGVAYSSVTEKLYAAAYIKRHSGLGPNGTGAIYQIDPKGNGVVAPSLFVDLNALFGANTAGVNPHPYTPTDVCWSNLTGTSTSNFACWFNDVDAWDAVGRQGLGDMDISEDGLFLYVMNMTNKTVYKIPTTNPTVANIQTFAFPTNLPGATVACSNATGVRPMALGIKNGLVYAGAVCTGEPTADGGSNGGDYIYIYALDPTTGTWTLKLEGKAARSASRYYTWRTGYVGGYQDNNKVMFSDIDFDNAGGMFIGMRDLVGDKYGVNAGKPIKGDPTIVTATSSRGDILKACYNAGTGKYELESDGSCGGVTTAGPASGYGLPVTNTTAKEYFYEDRLNPTHTQALSHQEISLGGVAFDNSTGEVWVTAYDMLKTYQQGIMGMSNSTGARTSSMVIIEDSSPTGQFGKTNGLGDLELINIIPCPVVATRKDTIKCTGTGPATNGFDYILTTTLTGGGTWTATPMTPNLVIDYDTTFNIKGTASGLEANTNYTFIYSNGSCTDTVKVAVIQAAQVCTPTFIFDNWTTPSSQVLVSNTNSLMVNSSTTDGANIVGGERDIQIQELVTTTTYSSGVQIVDNSLEWVNGPGDFSKVTITWDGNDNDANTLNATGLNGLNLTGAGNFGFLLDLVDVAKLKYTLRVYTDATNYSESVFTYNQSGTQFANIPVEFTTFTTVGGTGANFANVGAVQLIIEPLNLLSESNGIDMGITCFHSPCLIPCITPTATASATQPSCSGTNSPDNGGITIAGFTTGQRYQYSAGATFSSGAATPASITTIPAGGIITSTLSNTTGSYTVRIYDAIDNNCYVDRTISITAVVCCVSPSGKGYGEAATCSGTSANNDAKLNLYSLTNVTKYGYSLGSSYTGSNYATATTVSGTSASITNINTGGLTQTYTIRIFNGSDTCFDDYQITIPASSCNLNCSINGGDDQLICQPTSTVDLPDAGANQEWIVGSMNASGTATIDAATGVVNGMNANGIYSFILRDKTNISCQDEVFVFRGVVELPFITSCTSTYQLPAIAGVTWSSVSGGASVSSSGLITGMTTNGHYSFNAAFGACNSMITVEKVTCACVSPTNGTPVVTLGTCSGSTLNNDASINIASILGGDKAGISSAGAVSYDGNNYASATAVSSGSITFTNLQHGKNYIVRIFNTSDTCYTDVNVTIGTKTCCPSPNCGTVTVTKN